MEDFEKLGQFYLGKRYNLAAERLEEDLVLYDSKDLVTHGVCVGMTGSGKTGLCIGLLEEAAIDSIPAIVIDPKGDMANLLLSFPNLSAAEFLPWINADDAARANQSTDQFASGQAELWKKGLAQWGQDGQRIQRLRASADFAVYTPGSTSGTPVSVLNSFACPAAAVMEDREAVADLITSATSSLLGLIGIEGDPISSREHILISNIIQHYWKEGKDVDIASLIRSIQTPPFERVGAFVTDSFFPARDRYELALKLNNLLAAPGFGSWLEGEPLDVSRFLYTREGRPRVSIFSIAHLTDAERMFFVTLLLNQVVAWMRTQPGTTSLRAIIYMDEIAGYLPPVAGPPSKKPLMLLFKQARAFGVGVLLATQNPVDLDYKALSNAGTWFIGRLQTPQDIDRLVSGLGGGIGESESDLRRVISALGKRTFLMKNIHESAPEVFQTRWCLSYLRGPLTLAQIKALSAGQKTAAPAVVEPAMQVSATTSSVAPAAGRPNLPPQIPEFFLPLRGVKPAGAVPFYKPMISGLGEVHFAGGQSLRRTFMNEIGNDAISVNWDESQAGSFDENELEREPSDQAEFAPLAAPASKTENYKAWMRDFTDFLFRTTKIEMYRSSEFKLTSNPGESENDFRIRISQLAREKRDRTMESLRNKYGPKIANLQDRVRRAEQRVEKEKDDVKQAGIQTAISLGATVLGAFLGRKKLSTGTLGRASTTMRSGMRTAKERFDIETASENLEVLRQKQDDLEADFNAEMKALEGSTDPLQQLIETVAQHPKKSDVSVRLVALVWTPYWKTADGKIQAAY
ncbi:MAG: ATP-binding protein [Acidobacteria bacterium]|nr:ATP-binding protein [Acidobacteriota bacterium]